jgi:hypothetical protein
MCTPKQWNCQGVRGRRTFQVRAERSKHCGCHTLVLRLEFDLLPLALFVAQRLICGSYTMLALFFNTYPIYHMLTQQLDIGRPINVAAQIG